MTATSTAAPLVPSIAWYDDLCSCLQVDIGCVLQRHGWEPVRALGAGWRFVAAKNPVEPVEFYHPAGEMLADHLCLHHPVLLRWHQPANATEAHRDIVESLAHGTAPIVAVNNFHLPFRPAYHDVHAAHLVVVTGYDEHHDSYQILDLMPPAFAGPLPRQVLEVARDRIAVDDDSDPFFAGARPSWRWLEVRPTGPAPMLDWPWLRAVIRDNAAELRVAGQGLAALADLLADLASRLEREGPRPLRDIYVLGWSAQAEASLHSRFLAGAARDLHRPDVAEAARWVDAVAHAWTGFRVAAAHGAAAPAAAHRSDRERVLRHGHRLLSTWQQCLWLLDLVGDAP
jgi:hypothetical protein